MSVSKEDYKAAFDQFGDVSKANYSLSSSVAYVGISAVGDNETAFKNDTEKAKEAITELSSENTKLGELKAMKVGEGQKKYDAFSEKIVAYTKYVDNLLVSLKDIREANMVCDDASSSSDAKKMKKAIDACIVALEKVSDTPDQDVKKLLESLKGAYSQLLTITTKIAALKNPYGSQYDEYRSLRDQMYKVLDELRDAQSTYRSNVDKHSDEVDPKDTADDLNDFLIERIK